MTGHQGRSRSSLTGALQFQFRDFPTKLG